MKKIILIVSAFFFLSGPLGAFAQSTAEIEAEKLALDALLAALLTGEDIDDATLDDLADDVYENDTLKSDTTTAPVQEQEIIEPDLEELEPEEITDPTQEEVFEETITEESEADIDLSAVSALMPEQEEIDEDNFIPGADAFEDEFIPSADDFENENMPIVEEFEAIAEPAVKTVLDEVLEANLSVEITWNTQLLASDDIEIWVRHVVDEEYSYVDTVRYNDGRYNFHPTSNGHHFLRLRGLDPLSNEFTGMEIFLAKDVEIGYERVLDMRYIESERFLTMIDSRLESRSADDKKMLLSRLQERLSTKTNVEMRYYYKMRLDVVLEGIRGKVGGISSVEAL